MGLDFAQSKAHWSYSGFYFFRCRLAKEIGIDNLDEMQGFGGAWKDKPNGWQSWDEIDDPIKLLLDHSDCDGELSPKDCLAVALRLRELVTSWPDGDDDKQTALILADDMEECGHKGESLIFC